MGPYEILQRAGVVDYELELPTELSSNHIVFHVSMLKKCIGDIEFILPNKGLVFQENLSYEEVLIKILYRKVKNLRNKEVASEKLL